MNGTFQGYPFTIRFWSHATFINFLLAAVAKKSKVALYCLIKFNFLLSLNNQSLPCFSFQLFTRAKLFLNLAQLFTANKWKRVGQNEKRRPSELSARTTKETASYVSSLLHIYKNKTCAAYNLIVLKIELKKNEVLLRTRKSHNMHCCQAVRKYL